MAKFGNKKKARLTRDALKRNAIKTGSLTGAITDANN